MKDRYNLLYNNLWEADSDKLAKLGISQAKLRPWNLNLDQTLSNKPMQLQTSPTNPTLGEAKLRSANLNKSLQGTIAITPIKDGLIIDWNILESQVNNCTKCKLSAARKHVVLERGNRNARWMFIGEAPGMEEDIQGLAFVGASGQLLNKMIQAMQLDPQQDVYICNVIKCRPPSNRNPEVDEIGCCSNYMFSQIELIKPQIIITLGRFATQAILKTDLAMARLRGKVHHFSDIPVVASYHPSYLLRNPSAKKDAWDDLKLAMQSVGQ